MRIHGIALLAAAGILAACGGGGGGSNPLPPGPPIVTPTATPTSTATPSPASVQVTYPGEGGSETVSVTVQKSSNSGVTGVAWCAYRATDSPTCDSTHPYATSGTTRAGVQGNYWIGPTNHVDNGTSFTDTFQLNQSSGGDMGLFALVSSSTATFLNLTGAGVVVSSSPGVFQALTSSTETIGVSSLSGKAQQLPTVSGLGGTAGGWEYNNFEPNEVDITYYDSVHNTGGKALLVIHSSLPLFGTGTDLNSQGFTSAGQNSDMRFVPCGNQPPATPCNPDQTNTQFGTTWFTVQTNTTVNTTWPYLPEGDLAAFTGSMAEICGELMFFSSPLVTSGGEVMNFTQVRQENSDGTSSLVALPTGVSKPEVCWEAH